METLKIIKIGGNIIDDADALDQFLREFAKLEGKKILVHGGGKEATKLAKRLKVEVKMVDGRRVTDGDTLDIITMVYAGKINKNIIAKLQASGCNSIGFSGADGNSIIATKRPVTSIDYGYAGDVVRVNTSTVRMLLEHHIVPVFCAITHDEHGQLLNTNADTIASVLAIALATVFKTELYYCFEKNGVLMDVEHDDSVIELIDTEFYSELKDKGIIAEGMLPKLDNCFHALDHHVSKVFIGKTTMLFDQDSKFTTITR